MEHRICSKCDVDKPISQYRKYNDADRYSPTCKSCLNELDKNRKKLLRQNRNENVLATCEMCNENKPLKYFSRLKKFYKKKICKTCYPKFLSKQKNEWCRNERNTNMNYRIKKSIAARLRNVLNKTDSTMNYIGCNIQYLREWFEFNFTSDMNWENYGTYWSIDHVIPVCKFDLTNETEKLQCWNWSNMVPVHVKFNSAKHNIDLQQIDNVIYNLEKFKEEGSTTKWFSEEFILTKELATQKNSF